MVKEEKEEEEEEEEVVMVTCGGEMTVVCNHRFIFSIQNMFGPSIQSTFSIQLPSAARRDHQSF